MFSRVLMLNMRGIGLSDPLPEDEATTIEQWMDDITAGLDEVGSERAALFGTGIGGSLAMVFAATYPERTSALVLLNSTARSSAAPDYPFGIDREWRERTQRAMRQAWGQAAVLQLQAPELAADDRFRDWYGRFERYGASPGMALAVLKMVHDLDVRSVLPAIFSTDNPDESPPECPDTVGAPHPRGRRANRPGDRVRQPPPAGRSRGDRHRWPCLPRTGAAAQDRPLTSVVGQGGSAEKRLVRAQGSARYQGGAATWFWGPCIPSALAFRLGSRYIRGGF
jgi:pimeloyl-ACP methyl ester carboxylesterase